MALQSIALLSLLLSASVAGASRRRYNTAAKRVDTPGVLNVHVIAHTHDDVGWLKTVDEYYAGLNNTIQHASVRHILDSTIDSLRKNPDRKFIYVEQAYFQRWWAEQDADTQLEVQGMVSAGQLSFVNGGWCMHDEATTTYVDMIDNTGLGHSLRWDAINCNDPEIQDDPLLDDYNVNDVVARTVASAIGQAQDYVGDIYFTQGFDFNFEYAEEWYSNLDKWIHYTNLNTSIHGVNLFYSTPAAYARTKLAYPYSWPTKLPGDDGMPYADGPHSYWTGFYASRAGLKGYVRDSSSFFQAAKQVLSSTYDIMSPSSPLYTLAHAMSVAQHHDAVSGTSQQHVANDYAKRLAKGRAAVANAFLGGIVSECNWSSGNPLYPVTCDLANATICPVTEGLNTTLLFVYNSQAQAKPSQLIRVPVGTGPGAVSWVVYAGGSFNVIVPAQLLPTSAADDSLRTEYYSYSSSAPGTAWLVFLANVPAVGGQMYSLVPSSTVDAAPSTTLSTIAGVGATDSTLTNGIVTVTISGTTGMVSHFSCPSNGVDMDMNQAWYWYNASTGNDVDSQASGAYIFRPNSSSVVPVGSSPAAVTIVTGPIVSEARQVVTPWLTQVTRVWAGQSDFEIEWTVGPVPFQDGVGKEIITRYSVPSMASNATFATDSNGRDMYTRIRNYRPSWNATVQEPIAGNYYPVNTAIETWDASTGLTLWVVNDRSQAGASIVDGSVELMVHRRLQADDGRGVGEPLNETGVNGAGLVVRGTHRIGLQPRVGSAASRRAAVQDVSLFRPVLALMTEQGGGPGPNNFSFLAAPLPANVHLLSLEAVANPVGPPNLLIRLAHLFAVGEDAVLSANATVDLATFINPNTYRLGACTEMTLPGVQPMASAERTTYTMDAARVRADSIVVEGGTAPADVVSVTTPPRSGGADPEAPVVGADGNLLSMPITLGPLQVRTFVCSRTN